MLRNIVYLILFSTILAVIHASSDPVDRILANLEEGFDLSGLYYRSNLLLNENSRLEPLILWSMFSANRIEKGYIKDASGKKKRLHFLKSDFGAYSQKCYVKNSRIESCKISWYQKLINNHHGFQTALDSFLQEVRALSECHIIKPEKLSPISIQVQCQNFKSLFSLELKYRYGLSKQARFSVTLVPSN